MGERRAHNLPGRRLLALLALLAPAVSALPGCDERESSPEGRLLVLGLDGLDRGVVESMAGRGELPNMARVMEEGLTADVAVERPVLSPIVWTTYASGYPGEIHGIGGWTNTAGHPYTSADARTWRLWDAATAEGVPVLVSNWLMTWPATPVEGLMVTDRFVWSFPLDKPEDDEIREIDRARHERTRGTVHPATALTMVERWVPEDRWLSDHMLGYQVDTFGAPQHPLRSDETAVRVLERAWDGETPVAMVYLQGIDQVSHLYWPFTEPQLMRLMLHDPEARPQAIRALMARHPDKPRAYPLAEAASRAELEDAARWLPDMYRWCDQVVGRAMALLEPGDLLVVLSDHGFQSSASQPLLHGSHSDVGLLMAWGEGLATRGHGPGLHALDVGPTLLALAGLPVAEDMQGRIRDDLFQVGTSRSVSTRRLQREAVEPPPDLSSAGGRLRQQLEALGYVDESGQPVMGAGRTRD